MSEKLGTTIISPYLPGPAIRYPNKWQQSIKKIQAVAADLRRPVDVQAGGAQPVDVQAGGAGPAPSHSMFQRFVEGIQKLNRKWY